MSDEIIKRDQNHRTVGAAVTQDSDKTIEMLRVDPVTKYLLVNVTDTGATAGTIGQIAKRDQNHRPVCLAWDATNQVLQEVLTDVQGNLLCDLLLT